MNNTDEYKNLPFVEGYALQSYEIAEEGLLTAYKNNYHYWYIDGSIDTDMPSKWNKQRIDNMLSLIEKYKVKPIYHGNYKVPLASDVDELRQTAIEYVKKEVDLSSKLSSTLIIHGGVIVEPRLVLKAKKKAINNYLDSVLFLMEYASKKNVTLFLENLSNYKNYRPFHYIFTHAEEFDLILSATNAKFFLDLGHANIGNDSPKKIFDQFHSYIAGMSFSNNDGQKDQHLSLNKGTISYADIVSSINFNNWKGIIGFETRDVTPSMNITLLENIYQSVASF